jgi:hypothetical protein
MRLSTLRLAILFGILAIAFGIGCRGNTVASLEPEGVMYGINIFNVPSSLQPGQVHMLGARGLYPGTATYNITGYANWASTNTDIIELLGKGILRAKSGGTSTIIVSYKGVTKSVDILVAGPAIPSGPGPTVLSAIEITPTSVIVTVGGSAQFTATAVYSNGVTQPVTNLVDWRVSDLEPGFIIDGENANAWGYYYGLFRGTSVGTTVVSAYYAGVTSNYATAVVREY